LVKRRAEQNRRIETAMSHRLGKDQPVRKLPKVTPNPTVPQPPKVYLCKCNHVIDLGGGFDQCPKCGSALQFTLPLTESKQGRR
jgi:hypothetical protein